MITLQSSREEVLEEMRKLRELYALKQTLRYETKRDHSVHSESVGEHLYAMFVLADYFLLLEDPEGKLDRLRIHELILYHEIGEIDTGDFISHKKSEKDIENEREAAVRVAGRLPTLLAKRVLERSKEFDAGGTEEAQFAQALDKLEPIFEMFPEERWPFFKAQNMSREIAVGKKEIATAKYPYMKLFLDVWTDHLVAHNAFAE